MDPSIASIPRFAQNPRALPSAFAVLCAKPQGAIFAVNEGFGAGEGIFTFFAIGVQLLNCIPFSDTLRYSIKKPGLVFTSARFCCNSHQFYRCIKEERTVPRRKPLGSAFFLFVIQVFLSKQSSRPNGQNGGALGSTAARSTVTIQSADGTIYVQGTSDVTVTVSSSTTQIDTTGASTVDSWNSYAAA